MDKYSKKNLEKIVKKSTTIRGCLRNLGMSIGGANDKTLKKYIKLYNIDISHFDRYKDNINNLNKIPLEKILIENSTYLNNTHLKKRLYESYLKERECELCGQGEIWKGNKMSLILDHKNGVNNDNRIENLRIVCPNCNATLPTHCGKNIKK